MSEWFGEFDFIADLLAPLAGEGAFGLSDDGALLPRLAEGEDWVVVKDAMVETVHFSPDDAPEDIAAKLLRVNLSDLAAMGARPVGYLLSLSLDAKRDRAWLTGFCDGLKADQAQFGVHLFGGDTTSTPGPLSASLTAFGAVPEGQALRRNGARPGDAVWLTGEVGDAALALALRDPKYQAAAPALKQAATQVLRRPMPALEAGIALRGRANACIDISDGLIADLAHIARRSGVGIVLDYDAIPFSDAVRGLIEQFPELQYLPLHGGDDYQLAFTLPAQTPPPKAGGSRFTRIGEARKGGGVQVMRGGEDVAAGLSGWRHF